jgi:hypothetical protein
MYVVIASVAGNSVVFLIYSSDRPAPQMPPLCNPDRVYRHAPTSCKHVGNALEARMEKSAEATYVMWPQEAEVSGCDELWSRTLESDLFPPPENR